MSTHKVHGSTRRSRPRWIAAATVLGTVLAGVVTPAAAEAKPITVRPAEHLSRTWSAGSWVSGNGNTVSDVAKVIGATSTAGAALDGKGVGIALIDTGVAPVPGLPAAQIVNGPDLSFDSQASNLRYIDTYGHGTHLAGIIVGNDSAVGLKGIAPKAKLTSIKVGGTAGAVDVTQVIAALNWVVQHKNDDPANPIKVITLAYGTDAEQSEYNTMADPLMFAVEHAYRNGILVVVASGNTVTSLGRLASPAFGPFMLSVGSSDTMGTVSLGDDRISPFTSVSNNGLMDVVAPGDGIVSLRNPGSDIDVSYPGARIGEKLFRGSGSSQATAVVSAAAALLYQKEPTATPHEIREWIRRSVKPLVGTNSSRARGSLDLARALSISKLSSMSAGYFSSGLGSLDSARGSIRLNHNNTALTGASSIFGPFDNASWVTASNKKTAWNGGLWMGKRFAGDGWTGSSWASKTWAPATWTAKDWANQAWLDPDWAKHTWNGRYWSGGAWSGRYWSSSTWEAKSFSAKTWSTAGWY